MLIFNGIIIYVNAFISDLYVQQQQSGSRSESYESHLSTCVPLLIPHKLDSRLMGQMWVNKAIVSVRELFLQSTFLLTDGVWLWTMPHSYFKT